MKKELDRLLLICKKTQYKSYFNKFKKIELTNDNFILKDDIERYKKIQEQHIHSLKTIRLILKKYGIKYSEKCRDEYINYDKYDLVITVGGDGTFIKASHKIDKQIIFGVNSAPSSSVGKLCIGNKDNFEYILKNILNNKLKPIKLQRLKITTGKKIIVDNILNDILICHSNPAIISRYYISIKNKREEQRSSGLWISTPSGSTGAISSAGGKLLKITDNRIQYLPRELYVYKNKENYSLNGNILPDKSVISVTSFMLEGSLFIDGTYSALPFNYGTNIKVSQSTNFLNALT